MNNRFINTKNLFELMDIEPFLILTALVIVTWLFYKLFLKEVSEERHRGLKSEFKNLAHHFLILAIFFVTYWILRPAINHPEWTISRSVPYVAFVTLLWGMIVFVKVTRLMILQYLFLGSMKHGVPILIVNIFSLLLSVGLLIWTLGQVFAVQVTPLLTTTAAFSVILGLALQDTLGNLFAGISLQVDKSFEIGDWIEVINGGQKIVGQVKEMSWRATILIGWTDEIITLPNRVLANSQISNFAAVDNPIVRAQTFKIPYGSPIPEVKANIIEAIKKIPDIRSWPEPLALVNESHESWISLRVIYHIGNYGLQAIIADRVIEEVLAVLKRMNIEVATAKIKIESKS